MAAENPILNNPYEEPRRHYATSLGGELNYDDIRRGRRPFSGQVQSVPVRQRQGESLSVQELAQEYGPLLVNRVRSEVGAWRRAGYPQTTRITRELLQHWFLNEERPAGERLFFAQREAIETAVWLNEVAEKSNPGAFIQRELEKARSGQASLPRIAFKMATGAGKTVVMAALIAYHFFNRREYGNDVRFADYFLVVAPGITIRDRLAVLRVDAHDDAGAADYYYQRSLVPRGWRRLLHELNRRLVLTNYHAFEPKVLQGNKRSPFDGKIGADGRRTEAREDAAELLRRLLGSFRPGSRLLVLNDEAHHCYLPREGDPQRAEGEDAESENERAAVWFTGLRQVSARFKVRAIYDLSATPYFLTGSGYEAYSLFPWVVSDFGLIEAIESGLVKIPFLPTWTNTQHIDMPMLRNLYDNVKAGLPKAGQRRARARAREEGESVREAPPLLPADLKVALEMFYHHYEEDFRRRVHTLAPGTAQLELNDTPPVFIAVCNNTSVSKEVYKHLAGYELPPTEPGGAPEVRPGVFDLFSNYDPASRQPRARPPTLLIDSDALEHSGQINDDFKKVFAREIDLFKREHARVHGAVAAENISEAEILREVVNTVGRRGSLGQHVRCVVSVSMLTEGWDANTVTHIVGLRKFGSQLLCEQVAGRALRRRSYSLCPYDETTGEALPVTTRRTQGVQWKFPPEYAYIIGVPFQLFKGGGDDLIEPPLATAQIMALRERAALELTFPVVEGYRIDYPDQPITWDFSGNGEFCFDASGIPTRATLGNAFSKEEEHLTAEDVLRLRDGRIIFDLTRALLRDHFSDDQRNPEFQRFHELRRGVEEWYHTKVRVLGRDPEWKKLLAYHDTREAVTHLAKYIHRGPDLEQRIRPILNYYNTTSSTRYVRGQTTRETYPTEASHVNLVVLDSGWEGKAAKTLDDLAKEGHVLSWVKNAFLDFRVPYIDKLGKERHYLPDFLLHCRLAGGYTAMILLEVTGFSSDKAEKKWSVEHRWLPAVNAVRKQHQWPLWSFLELAGEDEVADLRNRLLAKTRELAFAQPLSGVWEARRDDELENGLYTEDFELPERRMAKQAYVELFN